MPTTTHEALKEQVVKPGWHNRIAARLRQWANDLEARDWTNIKHGTLLVFERTGDNLGYPIYRVRSVRGNMIMGVVQWSNQWRAPKFTPMGDAVFDIRCITEIYALMREFKK